MLNAIDLYCGAGGTTTGAEQSGCVRVKVAINHWKTAIYTHTNNHPHTKHICAPIDHVDPRDFMGDRLDMILASPECTHHSIARGGRPVDDQKRAGGWDVLKWVETLRPKYLVVENVREWVHWGPLTADSKPMKSKRGEFFKAWVRALEAANYRVEWRLLNAADFGEATSRIRLFVIARANRGKINWAVPSHSKDCWRPAAEIIDWSKEFPSIFARKKQLADKTLRRIEIGIRKFCTTPDGRPFIVHLRGRSNANDVLNPLPTVTAGPGNFGLASPFLVKLRGTGTANSIKAPLGTITAGGQHAGLALPFLVQYHNGPDGENRSSSVNDPVPVIDTNPRHAVVVPFLDERDERFFNEYRNSFLVPNFGERTGQEPRTHNILDPLPAVTGHGAGQLVIPYYGTGGAQSVDEPLSTVTTKHRHGLAMVSLLATMNELSIADIGFRMLHTDELLRAQGFPEGYKLHGTKTEQMKQIGNSVCVKVAKAICEALAV